MRTIARPSDKDDVLSFITGIKSETWLVMLGAAALVVIMLFHLATLMTYPFVSVDESWLANASWTWLTTGVNFDSIHAGSLDQYGYEWLNRYFLGQAPYALAFRLFGLGVFPGRVVNWLAGCLLLVMVVLVARRTVGLKAGLLAALLLALSWPFLQATRWRQDALLTALVMLAFWLALKGLQEDKTWPHFAAGFALGIGTDVHQSTLFFAPGLAVVYIAFYGKQVLFRRGTWLAALGGAVGLLGYAIMHIFPNPELFARIMSLQVSTGSTAEPPLSSLTNLLPSLIGELQRYHFRQHILEFVLLVIGGVWLTIRPSQSARLIIPFTVTPVLVMALLSGNKTDVYAIYVYPLFMLIVAKLFINLIVRPHGSQWIARAALIVLIVFAGTKVADVAARMNRFEGYDYYNVTDRIRAVIPVDARVMAPPTYWLGMADYDYRSSHSLAYFALLNDYSLEQGMSILQPDYIVLDDFQRRVLVSETDPAFQDALGNSFYLPRESFMRVLDERGELVAEFTDSWHGTIQIFALNWR